MLNTRDRGRREFLRAGSLGLFGLTLSQLVAAREADELATAATGAPSISTDGRHRPTKHRNCILLFMWGGPAQQDTWDLKPDAPSDYRGEFRPISTSVSGVQVCEHLPLMAQRMHQLALIRSMTHDSVDHTHATHYLLTGRDVARRGQPLYEDWPGYGAVMAQLNRGHGPLPRFVSMMPEVINGSPRFVEQSHGSGAGWLGPQYEPLRIDDDATKPDYLSEFSLRANLPDPRIQKRRHLLESLDQQLRYLDRYREGSAVTAQNERAFQILAEADVRKAFDLSSEPAALRERYGMNMHGQSVLQARRLVEAGVPLVTVFWPNDGITNVSVYWDTHNRNFIDLKERLCPVTDRAFSALLDDLQDRGMLDDTLVVWTGEMGRTPKVGQSVVGGAGAGRDGRDHWGSVFTSVLAGGGIRGGTVYGSSDRLAAYPDSSPTKPADLAATIYTLLGIDPGLELRDRLDRPLTLCDGKAIRDVMA
ncbi:MAG: DUF1501 domain-containing protein [Planctomycetaceae bacterium]